VEAADAEAPEAEAGVEDGQEATVEAAAEAQPQPQPQADGAPFPTPDEVAPEGAPAAAGEEDARPEAAEGAEAEPEDSKDEEGQALPSLEKWKEQALQRIQSEHMMAGLRGDTAAAEATGQLPAAAGADAALSEGGAEAAAARPAIGTFVRPTTPLKDRFNYLCSGVGATVLAASAEMQHERNILNEDKDKYMMT